MRVAEPLGQVEELARAAEPEARVGPRERLVAEDGVALEVPDRLEGDVELAVLEQLAQPADAVRVRQRRARGDLVEDDDRAADRALGLVDRGVGLLAQQREVARGRGEAADARRSGSRRAARPGTRPSASSSATRAPKTSVCGSRSANSSPPSRKAASPRAPVRQRRRDAAQDAVAVLVPEAVVAELEVVDVDHRERELVPVALGQRLVLGRVLVERAVVAEAGQRVGERALQRRSGAGA